MCYRHTFPGFAAGFALLLDALHRFMILGHQTSDNLQKLLTRHLTNHSVNAMRRAKHSRSNAMCVCVCVCVCVCYPVLSQRVMTGGLLDDRPLRLQTRGAGVLVLVLLERRHQTQTGQSLPVLTLNNTQTKVHSKY